MVDPRKVRTARGTRTQHQYAADLGVMPMQVSRWERGEHQPSLLALSAMARDAQQPMDWFLKETKNV